MNILSICHFAACAADLMLIALLLGKRAEALVNRLCAMFIATFTIWSMFSGLALIASTAQDAMLFMNISSIGWCISPVIGAWFYLALAKEYKVLLNKGFIAASIILPLVFVSLEWSGNMVQDVYSPPATKDSARQYAWFLGRVTDTSDLFKGYAKIDTYKCSTGALRTPLR